MLAEERKHKDTTEEHLLLALLDNPDARDALIGCGADPERLRMPLLEFIDHDGVRVATDEEHVAQPNGGFQRAVQHASISVDREGGNEITGADVLAELLDETETDAYAVHLLKDHGVTRLDVSRYLSASRRQRGPRPTELAEPATRGAAD
jgi:ATP-dependent Clp protease ATP-binding subunit ClpA